MLLPFLLKSMKTAIKREAFDGKRELPWPEVVVVISIVGLISYLMTR